MTGIVTENVYGIEPMWSWGRVLAVAVLLGAIVAPARATDHFNLESRIPVTIEDIEPIERGSIEFQAFGRFSRLPGRKNFGETEPRLVLGIFEKTQLEIAAPLLLGQGAANGNGDTQISVLRKFRDSSPEKRWPGFAVEAELRLPSGIQRHGFKNRVDAAITALVTKHMARHSFHVNAGFDWSGDESQEERLRRGVWSGAVGHHTALTKWIVLASDLAWTQADEKQTRDIWLLETGVRVQLTRKLIGAIGVGAGLNRGPDTPVLALTFGFQIGL